jgi:hypothetical protein
MAVAAAVAREALFSEHVRISRAPGSSGPVQNNITRELPPSALESLSGEESEMHCSVRYHTLIIANSCLAPVLREPLLV